jgi:hypothetical protein
MGACFPGQRYEKLQKEQKKHKEAYEVVMLKLIAMENTNNKRIRDIKGKQAAVLMKFNELKQQSDSIKSNETPEAKRIRKIHEEGELVRLKHEMSDYETEIKGVHSELLSQQKRRRRMELAETKYEIGMEHAEVNRDMQSLGFSKDGMLEELEKTLETSATIYDVVDEYAATNTDVSPLSMRDDTDMESQSIKNVELSLDGGGKNADTIETDAAVKLIKQSATPPKQRQVISVNAAN